MLLRLKIDAFDMFVGCKTEYQQGEDSLSYEALLALKKKVKAKYRQETGYFDMVYDSDLDEMFLVPRTDVAPKQKPEFENLDA